MLKVINSNQDIRNGGTDNINAVDINTYIGHVRRQWPLVLFITAIFIAISLIYVVTAQPKFTASGTILIDTRKNQLLSATQQVVGDQVLDATGVESQVELLKSDSIALVVINQLRLLDNKDFWGRPSIFGSISNPFTSLIGSSETREDREQDAVANFAKNLQIKRLGLTYAIDINYTAASPELAAAIVNSIADAYSVSELESRYDATKRASKWLQDRIKDLREEATLADAEVQKFRTENNIVDTGRGLLTEQQLGDVNSQLITARAATAEAKARLDRISEMGKNGLPSSTVTDALRSDVISRLRAQYLDLAAKQSDWAGRYGQNHTSVQNLGRQMLEIRRSISDEVGRIAETYKSEYEIAKTREDSLQKSLAELVADAGSAGKAQIKLRDLTSSAQVSRTIYDSFLQRFMEATQQQTFPVSEARMISVAVPPRKKSSPRTLLILPASASLGLLVGLICALGREHFATSVFQTAADLESVLGTQCLGVLTQITNSKHFRERNTQPAIAHYAITWPLSRFAETMRSIKVALDLWQSPNKIKVIGIVSSLPNEGKSTVSSNLASATASSGKKVLLIDGDLKNPSLSRQLTPNAAVGIVEVLKHSRSLSDVEVMDAESGVVFVPAVSTTPIWETANLLSSDSMKELLDSARRRYDYIIVDLPPILSVVDAKAVSGFIDSFVLVVEWNKTSRAAVVEAIESVPSFEERLVGAVLNKANPAYLSRVEIYKGQYYNSYYQDERGAA